MATRLQLLVLEQRFMFDGAAVSNAAHAAGDAAILAQIADVPTAVQVRAADVNLNDGKKEVVFVDTSVADYKTLEANIGAGIEIEEINGGQDGLAQIAKWAETNGGYDAIHILSHGAEGQLILGANTVTDTSLNSGLVQAELAEIGHALNAGGDLLLYGCNVASGNDGAQFVTDLAAATGADVAASTDATGASSLGGDWALEKTTGTIDTISLDATDYGDLLAQPISGTTTFGASNWYSPIVDASSGYTVSNIVSSGWDFTVKATTSAADVSVNVEAFTGQTMLAYGATNSGATHLVYIQLASNDGKLFDLNAIDVTIDGVNSNYSGTYSIQLVGYRGGSAVSGATLTIPVTCVSGGGLLVTFDVSSNTAFEGIDTFRVLPTGSDYIDGAIGIDNVDATNFHDPGPTFTSGTTVNFAENGTGTAYTAAATASNGTVSYSITGGADASKFIINNSTGAVTFNSTPNYESPADSGTNNVYDITITATDSNGSSAQNVVITVTNVNEAPSVTSGTTASVAENSTGTIYTATGTDPDSSQTLAWSLSGTDAGQFTINSSTGAVSFNSSPNYESPTDSGGNNVYDINVIATDNGTGNLTATKAVTITVTDVNDAPVNIKPGTQTTNEDTALVFSSGNGNALSVADQDAGTTLTTVLSIAGGTGTLNVTTGGSASITGNGSTSVTIIGSAAQVNAALASVTYTPTANASGAGYATLSMSTTDDGTGTLNDSDTVTVNVTAVNDAPTVTVPGSIAVTEDVAAAITGISFADVDAGGSSVTATLAVGSGNLAATSGGGVTVAGSGTGTITLSGTIANINTFISGSNVSFTTAANATSAVTLTSSIDDGGNTGSGGNQTASDTTTLNVTAINDAPTVTVPGSIAVTEDVASAITGIGFADVDAGSSSVTATLAVGSGSLAAASGGSVTVAGSGTGTITLTGTVADINAFIAASNVSFTTAANATGAVTLTSSINDGGNTGSGGNQTDSDTTTLNVTAIADTPTITTATTTPGTQTVNGLVINRNAGDGAEVGYFKITGITGGTLYLNDGTTAINNGDFITYTQAHAGLRFTPSGSSNGSFDLQASTSNGDAGLGGSVIAASITVGVGVDSPTIAEDNDSGAIAISGDTAYYKITGITGGTLYSNAGFTTPITEGTFIATAGATTNVYFRPSADFDGSAGFSVQGSSTGTNGGLTGNTAASSITVSAVNDAPTVTAAASIAVTEDVANALTGISFADVDAGSSSVTATLAVDSGTLAASSGSGVSVAGSGSDTLTLTGSIADINAFIAASKVSFTTATNATGAVTLTSSIDDGGNTGAGGNLSASDTTTLNVLAANDAPTVTVPGSIAVTEDVAAAITGISFTDADAGSSSVTATLAVASGTLAASSGSGVTVGGSGSGTLTLTGSIADINAFIAASKVSFTTAANATNTVTLTSSINDSGNTGAGGAKTDSATTSITVSAVNDAPTVTAVASIAVTEDAASALTGISFTDIDAGSSSVTATLAVGSGTLAATSGSGVTVAGSGSGTMTLTGSIADINAFIAASKVSFTTAANALGAVTLTSSIDDGGYTGSGGNLSASDTTTLNVLAANDAPTVTVPGSIAVTEDVAAAITGISFTDADAGSSSVTATLAVGSGTLAASSGSGVAIGGSGSGTLTLTGSIADINAFIAASEVTFTTAANATGAVTLTSSINDGGNTGAGGAKTDSATTSITVAAVNDAPIAGTIGNQNATETLPFTFTIPGSTFSDPDTGDHLTYSATLANGSPLPGWLTFDPTTRTFSGTPGNGDLGAISLRVTVTDGGNLTASTTFTLQVATTVIPPQVQPPTPPIEPPSVPVVVPPAPPTSGPPIEFLTPQSGLGLNSPFADTASIIFGSSGSSTVGNSPTDRPAPGSPPGFHVATAPAGSGLALVVNHGMSDTQIPTGGHMEISVPTDTFAHSDPNATVVLTLQQVDGRPLPAWVRFNPATGKLVIDPPPGFEGRLTLRLTARDSRGHEAVTTFRLVVGQRHAPDGRTSLNTQLQDAIRPSGPSSHLATLAAHVNDVLRLRA